MREHSDTAHEPRPRIEPGLTHPRSALLIRKSRLRIMPTPEVHGLSSRSEGRARVSRRALSYTATYARCARLRFSCALRTLMPVVTSAVLFD